MDQEIKDLCLKLKGQGIVNLSWSAEPASKDRPWAEGWADVYIEEICQPLDLNWLITVVDPMDKFANYDGNLAIKKDAELIFYFKEGQLAADKKVFLKPGSQAIEIPLEKDLEDDLGSNEFYWSIYKRPEYQQQKNIYVVPVWSIEKIQEVVTAGLESVSGVKFNLTFNPDKPSPIKYEVEEELEKIKNGEKTFDLGDGVKASKAAFDAFLNDPEMAKDVLKEIKKNLK